MLPSIKNILFATDLSDNADFALTHAVGLAQSIGAEITVLHVAEALSTEAAVTLQIFMQDEEARNTAIRDRITAMRRLLKSNQKDFLASLPESDKQAYDRVNVVELVEGHPAEAILRLSKEQGYDLIVLGAHEHGLGDTFLGSITKKVLRRATIPTLVVPYAQ